MKKSIFQSLFVASVLIVGLALADAAHAAGYGKRQVAQILSLSDDANGCFVDQTAGGAVALTLNGALASGGVCTFASAQQISIEGAGNESGVVVVIVGTDADGKRETESLTLANAGTAKSARWYKTIESITSDGATTGNIEGGPLSTNGAVSATLVPDLANYTAIMSLVVDSCVCTYTVDHTSMNMPSTVEPIWFSTVGLTALTADAESNIVAPVGGVRLKLTAYTSGTAELLMLQDQKK
jgi:hypothetical protein